VLGVAKLTTELQRRKAASEGEAPDRAPISLNYNYDTKCTKCGGEGHIAKECFALKGEGGGSYGLVEAEDPDEDRLYQAEELRKLMEALDKRKTRPNDDTGPKMELLFDDADLERGNAVLEQKERKAKGGDLAPSREERHREERHKDKHHHKHKDKHRDKDKHKHKDKDRHKDKDKHKHKSR